MLISGTTYTDSCIVVKGVHEYMVRALKLELGTAGSYYNLSQGLCDTAYNSFDFSALAAFNSTLAGVTLSCSASHSLNPSYSWNFGNGQSSNLPNPVTSYVANGLYTVVLTASHPCYTDSSSIVIQVVSVRIPEVALSGSYQLLPNPGHETIRVLGPGDKKLGITLFSIEGKQVKEWSDVTPGKELDVTSLARGVYLLQINDGQKTAIHKLLLE